MLRAAKAAIALVLAVSAALVVAPAQADTAGDSMRVGASTLKRCNVMANAWCGTISRQWNPANPSLGTFNVGFAFVPARSGRSIGTLVPHEGGPGYSTTGSGGWFAEMYDTLLDDRDMLLVDQRGMGMTAAIACPDLDNGVGNYVTAVGKCAQTLGPRAGLYGTALSADDLAAVLDALGIGQVDMYGDSYGTFFAQVFAGRYPTRLRTLVLDGAYPTYGETAWYPTQGPALSASLTAVCARSVMCAGPGGDPMALLTTLLGQLRAKSVRVTAPGADGARYPVTLTASAVSAIAYNATYMPTTYREFTGAVRAALAGDYLPMGRLYAEYLYTGEGAAVPTEYSAGAEAAVTCHDYPQLFHLNASLAKRQQQYAAAFTSMQATNPGLYAPFTLAEYRDSGWTSFDMCLRWPTPDPTQPAGPVQPPGGQYPAVPTLVISGELDTITSPAEAAIAAGQFPSARAVTVANALHVAGGFGTTSCGARLVRNVVTTGSNAIPPDLATCAANVPPIRAVGNYARSYLTTPLPTGATDDPATRVAVTAVNTAADVIDRWYQTYATKGLGLRGGTFTFTGDQQVAFTLTGVKLVDDLAVSGRIDWNRQTGQVTVNLRVPSTAGITTITGSWNAIASGATATIKASGTGTPKNLSFLAP